MRRNLATWGVLLAFAGLLVLSAAGCGDDAAVDGDGTDESFILDYRSGASALLDLSVEADLHFSGKQRGIPPTLESVRVGQAHAILRGDGQQGIELVLSTGDAPWEGETLNVYLQFGRANDGEILDRGDALEMLCNFYWTGPDYDFGVGGSCSVRQTAGGYSATIVETYDEETGLSGTISFNPVSNEPYAYTPGHDCPSDQICLSLDPNDYEAEAGYCLPTSNLKSAAIPCTDDCASQLVIETGGEETCVCSAPCGAIDTGGGGGDPPVCDPAYGCIDF